MCLMRRETTVLVREVYFHISFDEEINCPYILISFVDATFVGTVTATGGIVGLGS